VTFPDGLSLKARQKANLESGSIVADPGFADPQTGDFTLPRDSPVWDLGFKPIDLAAVGRKTDRVVSPDMPPVPTPWPEAIELAGEETPVDGGRSVETTDEAVEGR
jgi:hypothetical protein